MFAIRSDGRLFAWGDNSYGVLGLGTQTVAYSSPVQVGSSSWSALATNGGDWRMAAIRLGGNLFIWGSSGGNYTGTYNNGYQEYYTSFSVLPLFTSTANGKPHAQSGAVVMASVTNALASSTSSSCAKQ